MADSFNMLQEQVRDAAFGLDEARENMRVARAELLARHVQIAHLAHHDPLTELPNRTLLAAKLDEVFEHAKARNEDFPTTCSGIRWAMSCYAPCRDGSRLPPMAT